MTTCVRLEIRGRDMPFRYLDKTGLSFKLKRFKIEMSCDEFMSIGWGLGGLAI